MPLLGSIEPSGSAWIDVCQKQLSGLRAPRAAIFCVRRCFFLWDGEELPAALLVVEDEVNQHGAGTLLIVDLRHQDGLAYTVSHSFGRRGPHLLRLRKQFTIRTRFGLRIGLGA